jgi:hypothetical protein
MIVASCSTKEQLIASTTRSFANMYFQLKNRYVDFAIYADRALVMLEQFRAAELLPTSMTLLSKLNDHHVTVAVPTFSRMVILDVGNHLVSTAICFRAEWAKNISSR